MSHAISAARLILVTLLLCTLGLADDGFCYESSDGKLFFQPPEEYQRTVNPHAVLSLQSKDDVVVLVTTEKEKFTITQLFDGMPATFDDGAQCVGRVLLSVDGGDAATFLVEGMFPPDQEATYNTVYAVTNHEQKQYTIMIHYPAERGDEGLEWATDLLHSFSWNLKKI